MSFISKKASMDTVFAGIQEKKMTFAEIARDIEKDSKKYENFKNLIKNYSKHTKNLDLKYADGTPIPDFMTLGEIRYQQSRANQAAWLSEIGLIHTDDKSTYNRKLMYISYNLKLMVDRYNAMVEESNRGYWGNERTKIAPYSTGYVLQRLEWAQQDNRLHNIKMEVLESRYGLNIQDSKKYIKAIAGEGTSERKLLPDYNGSKILLFYYNTRKAVYSSGDMITGNLLDWIALHHPEKLYDALKILDDPDKVDMSYLKAYQENVEFYKGTVTNNNGTFNINRGYIALINDLFGRRDPRRGLESQMQDIEINTTNENDVTTINKFHILKEAIL